MLKVKLIALSMILIFVGACSEFALLASGTSIAVSQNAYSRAYSGLDVFTIIQTEKDIKTHIYHTIKEQKERFNDVE